MTLRTRLLVNAAVTMICFAAVIGVLGMMSLLGELGVTAFT